ncbi:MAG: peroxiredoxin [Planctomycetes bacterium]|nr:peroxiredoxin [Planctomycetota bacterium]
MPSAPAGQALTATVDLAARGETVSLQDFRGKHVVVYFYPKDDTPGCTKEAQAFRDLFAEFERQNVVILGDSPDSAESHGKFCCKYDLPFTLLCDPAKKVMTRYGAFGEKMMYGKKTTGVIRSTVWIGPDGKVRKHRQRVSSAGDHPAQVLEAVRAAVAEGSRTAVKGPLGATP